LRALLITFRLLKKCMIQKYYMCFCIIINHFVSMTQYFLLKEKCCDLNVEPIKKSNVVNSGSGFGIDGPGWAQILSSLVQIKLECNFHKKMFVDPKSGIFNGSTFTLIPILNLMFCKVGGMTNKLKLFWLKIKTCSNRRNTMRCDVTKFSTFWVHRNFLTKVTL